MFMKSLPMRITLILTLLAFCLPSLLFAATERRIALVIGNSAYSSGPLKNPVTDATDVAAALQKLGFQVSLKKNADLEAMEGAIEEFGNRLKRGGVGLFYYAGHGVQVGGANYLIPIGAKIDKESDVRYKAVDAGRILDEMANANNGLNIVILDACRDNPFGRSFRSASRGLAMISNSPSGTFISYSTSPGQVARDGEGKNSPYTRALLENITKPGLTINDVFMNVRTKVKKETGQVPWELSSLEGRFYFNPGREKLSGADEDIDKGKTKVTMAGPPNKIDSAIDDKNVSESALDDGLVAYYPFDGKADDMSGKEHHGIVSGATLTTDRNGNTNSAYYFDNGAVIIVADAPDLNFAPTASMSVSLWAYRTGGASQMHIMGKRMYCSRDNFNYQMAFDNPPGFGLLFGSIVPDMAQSRIDLPMNSWMHLVGTFDGQTFRMYMNRALIGASSLVRTLGPTSAAQLTIGRSATCSYFTGKIDNVRIYRRALTQTDINQLYKAYK